jgi:hypothetical protein
MPNNNFRISSLTLAALIASTGSLFQAVQAAEILTLFTTPEERQIINSNRYKKEEIKTRDVKVDEVEIEAAVQQLILEEVSFEYKISGITISSEGPHTIWINEMAYEDGEQLEDKSEIKILTGDKIQVRITTPDGKHHYASSGEMLEITYLAPIEH